MTHDELYQRIHVFGSIVWSPKSGEAKEGYKVILGNSERLHRLMNFTLYRLESFLSFNRSTLSDFEFDYYLSVTIRQSIVYMDIARVFPSYTEAKVYADKRGDSCLIEEIDS